MLGPFVGSQREGSAFTARNKPGREDIRKMIALVSKQPGEIAEVLGVRSRPPTCMFPVRFAE